MKKCALVFCMTACSAEGVPHPGEHPSLPWTAPVDEKSRLLRKADLVKRGETRTIKVIEEICRVHGVHAHFGATVRRLREERGMTLQEFGDALGLSHPHIWHIEHGTRRMSLPSLTRLKTLLEREP